MPFDFDEEDVLGSGPVFAGNDSIHVMLSLAEFSVSSADTSEPALCGTRNIIAVLSLPVRVDAA